MLTLEKIIDDIKSGKDSSCIDGRDYNRLAKFLPADLLGVIGYSVKEGGTHEPVDFTEANVLISLKNDVEFGFEKALNKRWISSGLMYEVVKMWMYVLEDDIQYMDEYAQYGLPLLKAVAVKYGLENPIGDDSGDEEKYASN